MTRVRRGYSLVECLVVISLLAFILSTVTLALHSLRRGDSNLRDCLAQELAVERLVALLQQDVHQATGAVIRPSDARNDPTKTLQLSFASDRTIEYSLGEAEVVRLLRSSGEVQNRDSFAIGAASTGRWQIDSARELPLVTVWLPRSGQRAAQPELSRFCAAVGLENE